MLEVHDITIAYDGAEVLSGCSVSLAPGELIALVGDNGCGKSSLGRAMCASQLVDEGAVVVDGHDPSVSELERLRVRALVGRLCQDYSDQIVSSLVFDEVAFGPRNLGLDEDDVCLRVQEALGLVGMPDYGDRVTNELSGGEQQRIALAGVLAMHPAYLILDEPTAQLDPDAREAFRALFVQLAHVSGIGIALITHDRLEVELADRVIDLGRTAFEGACPPASLQVPGASRRMSALAPSALRDAAALGSSHSGQTPAASALLEMEHISFAYGSQVVLSDVSLSVGAGEVVMLAGRSGAGKSTLALIAAGLIKPDSGTVRVDGDAPVPGSVGLAFQQPESQFFLDTVWDEVAYGPMNLSCDDAEVERRVDVALKAVGLETRFQSASPFELSGGQARRVALASVLALGASVYVFDEPSAALDHKGRDFAHRFVSELAASGCAVVVITHDVDEWRAVATRHLMLSHGALCEFPVGESFEVPGRASGPHGSCDSLSVDEGPFSANGAEQRAATRVESSTAHSGRLTAFGAYIPHTPASKLDARVKIVLLLVATVGIFSMRTPLMGVVWFAVLWGSLRCARVPLGRVVRGMRPVAIVLLFTLVANLVSCDGRGEILLAGPIGLDPAGGMRGLMAVLRIALLVGFSLAVASSTTGAQLSDACVRLLGPLARFGVPVGSLGTVLSIALRFIPLVSEELNRIRFAQRARGADFDSGPLANRIGTWASVLTPLVIGLFRRADRLADAMAARCYDAVAAGRLPAPRALAAHDRRVLLAGCALMACLMACGFVG